VRAAHKAESRLHLGGPRAMNCVVCGFPASIGKVCSFACGLAFNGSVPTCDECGVNFEPKKYWQRFCSLPCARAFHKRKRKDAAPVRECHGCGCFYQVAEKTQRYCSIACASKKTFHEKVFIMRHKTCVLCSAQFKSTNPSQKFCGEACRNDAKLATRKKMRRLANLVVKNFPEMKGLIDA
jgi:predicted nucleic acid-binding Zn ribbon protein